MSTMKVIPALILGTMLACGLQLGWSQDASATKNTQKAGDSARNAARKGTAPKPVNAVKVAPRSKTGSISTTHKGAQGTQSGTTTQPQ